MTEVNYAEVQYIVRRKDGETAWQTIARELVAAPIQFHAADRVLADSAADFKTRFKISLADAFAAALAKRENAELVTGDPEFKPLEKEIDINWLKGRITR
jgi:ribonuclease VapC